MPTQTVNGVQLYYEDHGRGSPLVLIPGYASDTTAWAAVRPLMAGRHRLILVDNRGSGRSETPARAWSIADMAEDVTALLEALRIPRAHVLGHSMGGSIALELARRHPQRVERLVVSNAAARIRPATAAAFRWLLRLRASGVPLEVVTEGLFPWLLSNRFLAVPENISSLATVALANPHPPSLDGQTRQLDAITAFDSGAFLRGIDVPTLVIAGEEDLCAPVAAVEALAHTLPRARLVTIRDVAHLPMLEAPAEFARAVLEFCAPGTNAA